MTTPVWVPLQVIIIIHDRQIARHGSAAGMRKQSLLKGAVKRTEHKNTYGTASLPDIAAVYTYAIAKTRAFVDGNKRTAFVTAATFLRLNGFGLRPDPFDGVGAMEDLASGALTEEGLSEWLAQRIPPIAPHRDEG